MPPRLSWSQLLPGVIALTLIVLTGVAILVFAGVNRIGGETIRVYAVTAQALGLIKGSEVWLAGQKVGAVEDVGFRAPSSDSLDRVVITMKIKSDAGRLLRRESRAEVKKGGSVMGPVVVYLESGPPTSAPLRDGDTLRARAQTDLALASEKLVAATSELPALMSDARTVMAHVRDGDGTIGGVLSGGAGANVNRLRASVSRIRAQMSAGGGDGRAGPRTVMRHASQALARVDSIKLLLRSPTSSFGRFRRDSTLGASIASVRDELAQISERIEREQGTLYRMQNDSALVRSLAAAKGEMALLFDDLRRHPLRYLHF